MFELLFAEVQMGQHFVYFKWQPYHKLEMFYLIDRCKYLSKFTDKCFGREQIISSKHLNQQQYEPKQDVQLVKSHSFKRFFYSNLLSNLIFFLCASNTFRWLGSYFPFLSKVLLTRKQIAFPKGLNHLVQIF